MSNRTTARRVRPLQQFARANDISDNANPLNHGLHRFSLRSGLVSRSHPRTETCRVALPVRSMAMTHPKQNDENVQSHRTSRSSAANGRYWTVNSRKPNCDSTDSQLYRTVSQPIPSIEKSPLPGLATSQQPRHTSPCPDRKQVMQLDLAHRTPLRGKDESNPNVRAVP